MRNLLIKKLAVAEDARSDFYGYRPEVVAKVIKEVVSLFRLPLYDEAAEMAKQWERFASRDKLPEPDGEIWELSHLVEKIGGGAAVRVTTFFFRDGRAAEPMAEISAPAEGLKAAVHRLVKLNFYRILLNDPLCRDLGLSPAPWGILHGVRPTKIVHHSLDGGKGRRETIDMLRRDYGASEEKSALITDLAIRQRPFLKESDAQTVSLYVGIPFCRSRCLYCSFPAYVLPDRAGLEIFWRAFMHDMAAAEQEVARYGFKVQSIYIGGGTPTSLPDDYFAHLLDEVRNRFYSAATKEFTVEAGRPDSLNVAKIAALTRHGVTRVSINPQTMQEKTLRCIGRCHRPKDVVAMYHLLRGLGDFSINMDLIIGLPGEDAAAVADTMEKLAPLKPDDITLHALALKRGSLLSLHFEKLEAALPNDEEAQEMFAVAKEAIESWGLRPYYLYRQGFQRGELENIGFCRDGAESLYNIQIMEERQTIIGVGGAATTKAVDPATGVMRAAFNAKELSVYIERIENYAERRRRLLAEAYGVK